VTSEGIAYCWGDNFFGELGDGTKEGRSSPTGVATELRFSSISAGNDHSCGIATTGAAYCWGRKNKGQLGDGTQTIYEVPVAPPTLVAGGLAFTSLSSGSEHTCGITPEQAVYCWGANEYGQLGDGSLQMRTTPVPVAGGLRFSSIELGHNTSCGITPARRAYCWGRNDMGQVGDGTYTHRSLPTRVVR
jgi:alpha-tubulin suppressor-like RCC1 family protein